MGNGNLGPADGLTTPANEASGQKSQFALFSDNWLELQGFIGASLDLPISSGDFETKYGSLGASKTITDCIEAMKGVQKTSTEFGDPKQLRKSLIDNPNLLATDTPPTEIYTHTVWMGQRTATAANNISSGFNFVSSRLPGLPDDQVVAKLKQFLFSSRGPIAIADEMNKEIGDLIVKLGKFEEKMNAFNAKMAAFTSESSAMMADVSSTIGRLDERIKGLEKDRDDAYEAWKNFTIAAVSAAVGCVLIGAVLAPFTAGASLAVGAVAGLAAGVGLGVKAAQNRAKYNEFCKQIVTESTERKKKIRLRSDLGDFDRSMKNTGPAMSGFLKSLQQIQGAWVGIGTDTKVIADSLSPSTFSSDAFFAEMDAQNVVDKWTLVGSAAKQFTTESLVDYTSLAFGDEMPEITGIPDAA